MHVKSKQAATCEVAERERSTQRGVVNKVLLARCCIDSCLFSWCLSRTLFSALPCRTLARAMMQDYWIEESVKDKPFEDFYELGRELGK